MLSLNRTRFGPARSTIFVSGQCQEGFPEELRQILDAPDTDLSAFKRRGGKLLMYFAWADPQLDPLMGVEYYEQVTEKMGNRIEASRVVAGKVVRTRPLYTYPQVARYKGSGSIDETVNFSCLKPYTAL